MPEQITVADILLVPGLLVFIGAVWFLLAWNQGRIYEKPNKKRWGGVVVLALAAIFGGTQYTAKMSDAFYRAQFVGPGTKRLVIAHYLAFFGPLLMVGLAFAIDRLTRPRY